MRRIDALAHLRLLRFAQSYARRAASRAALRKSGSTSRAAMPAKHAPSPSCLVRGCVLHFRCLQTSASAAIPASHAGTPCVTLCARGSAAGFVSPPVKAEPPPAVRIFLPSRRAVSWSIFMCHTQNGQRRRLLHCAPSESKSSMVHFYRPQSRLKNVVRELPAHCKAAARCAAGYSDNLRSKRRRRFFRQPSG